MINLSNERLQQIIDGHSPSLRWGEASVMARELLAARKPISDLRAQAVALSLQIQKLVDDLSTET